MAKPILPDAGVKAAVEAAGGINKLARLVGVTRQSIYYWRRVPAEHVITIERATDDKVTRHQLRPDIYPEEDAAA